MQKRAAGSKAEPVLRIFELEINLLMSRLQANCSIKLVIPCSVGTNKNNRILWHGKFFNLIQFRESLNRDI